MKKGPPGKEGQEDDGASVSRKAAEDVDFGTLKSSSYSLDIALTVGAFSSKVKELEHLLSEASKIEQVEDQRNVLNHLRVMLNQGVETWPNYDVLRAQNLLRAVEEIFDATRGRLAPRRKFQFRAAAHETSSSRHKPILATLSRAQTPPRENENETGKRAISDVQGYRVEGEVLVKVIGTSDVGLSTIGGDQEVEGRAVVIRGEGRFVKAALKDGSRSVSVIGLSRCVIETGNVDGSVWVSDCSWCLFRTRCRQLRVHSSSNCRLFVYVTSSPIIENCSTLAFGPLGGHPTNDGPSNKWSDVADMCSLRESGSSNWISASLPTDDDDSWVHSPAN